MAKEHKAVLKFNNGRMAILCSWCSKIIKTGVDFDEKELAYARGGAKIGMEHCSSCRRRGVEREVYAYINKDKRGFSKEELNDIKSRFYITDEESFNDALSCITGIVSESGDFLIFHRDISNAIIAGLEKRKLNAEEWD